MGFEPMISTLTGWRALRAAPRGHVDAKNGSGGIRTLSISRSKREWSAGCLPSQTVPGAGIEPAASTFRAWRHYQQQLPRSRRFREGGFEPPPPDSKSGSLPVSRFPRRKERELNPQGSSLARFRVGCRRQSACPSVSANRRCQMERHWDRAPAGGVEPPIVALTGRRLTVGPHRYCQSTSGWPDSNRRSPAPEAGGLNQAFLHPEQSAQRESNPHFRLGKAIGCRYIMGTCSPTPNCQRKPRAPGGTRTHVAALRVRCLRR